MSRYHRDVNTEPILRAAQHWRDVALFSDGSVFGNESVWTLENLESLKSCFKNLLEEGVGESGIYPSMENQLKPAGSLVKQLAAEMLWLMSLCPNNHTPSTKLNNIKRVWEWSGETLQEESEWLSTDVLSGIGHGGTILNLFILHELLFFNRVTLKIKGLSVDERHTVLGNGWSFRKWLQDIWGREVHQLFNHLPFLLFPDEFESIFTGVQKMPIVKALSKLNASDVSSLSLMEIDQELLEIRRSKEEEYGTEELHFFTPPLRDLWVNTIDLNIGPNPINQILFGPPGTGKTYQLQQLVGEYSTGVRPASRSAWLIQEMQNAKWFEVVFGALYDLKGGVKADELINHEFVQAKERALGKSRNLRSTVWFYLGEHAVESSLFVHRKRRTDPLVFDRTKTGEWSLAGDWQDECAELVERARNWRAGPTHAEPHHVYEFVTFHQSYSYEDFVEGIRPYQDEETDDIQYRVEPGVFKRICQKAKADPTQRYAIFIDEINRGNIAKIFGELITLIEEDKRAQYDETEKLVSGMELTLPYSGERFGVPINLDIYGTMNTADRSIALLDTALRRRFQFKELMPDTTVIQGSKGDGRIDDGQGDKIDLRKFLDAINRRIRFLLNRDMTLGHAFFVNVKNFDDLKDVLFNKVIPLLQEYFYNDWHRIQLVFRDVGSGGEPLKPQIVRHATLEETKVLGFDHSDFDDSIEYSIIEPTNLTPETIRKVYEEIK